MTDPLSTLEPSAVQRLMQRVTTYVQATSPAQRQMLFAEFSRFVGQLTPGQREAAVAAYNTLSTFLLRLEAKLGTTNLLMSRGKTVRTLNPDTEEEDSYDAPWVQTGLFVVPEDHLVYARTGEARFFALGIIMDKEGLYFPTEKAELFWSRAFAIVPSSSLEAISPGFQVSYAQVESNLEAQSPDVSALLTQHYYEEYTAALKRLAEVQVAALQESLPKETMDELRGELALMVVRMPALERHIVGVATRHPEYGPGLRDAPLQFICHCCASFIGERLRVHDDLVRAQESLSSAVSSADMRTKALEVLQASVPEAFRAGTATRLNTSTTGGLIRILQTLCRIYPPLLATLEQIDAADFAGLYKAAEQFLKQEQQQ